MSRTLFNFPLLLGCWAQNFWRRTVAVAYHTILLLLIFIAVVRIILSNNQWPVTMNTSVAFIQFANSTRSWMKVALEWHNDAAMSFYRGIILLNNQWLVTVKDSAGFIWIIHTLLSLLDYKQYFAGNFTPYSWLKASKHLMNICRLFSFVRHTGFLLKQGGPDHVFCRVSNDCLFN